MSVLEADGLRLTHGRRRDRVVALDDVTLRVARGETLAIVGRSGSGKTTLAQLLLGLRRPDAGVVRWDGLVEGPRGRSRAFRQAVQLVAQDPATTLDPRWRVGDLVADPLRRLRVDCDVPSRVRESLRTVGLGEDLSDARPAQLSGGQAQRVALARAIATRPQVLVADEPTSGLDLQLRHQVLELLARLVEEQELGVLLVSHDLHAVAHLCRRVVVVDHGRVVEDRSTRDLLAHPVHPASQALVAAMPRLDLPGPASCA